VLGNDKKDDFLSVNWEYPRVRVILKKVIKLIPTTDEDLRSCVEEIASGRLADNYMTDKGDDDPRPETLPGIKLVRPWDSLLKKYERMTGKKVEESYDPTFNPRPEKSARIATTSRSDQKFDTATLATHSITDWWPWLVSLLLALPIIYGIRLFRKSSGVKN
jgi:hypothetical protein